MNLCAELAGCGSYLPPKVVTNDELAKTLDTSDEWIYQRTGIRQRHVAEESQLASDLGYEAAKAALAHSNVKAQDIDLVVCCTTTPDQVFPATATVIQRKLGIVQGAAFDLQAVCSGFVYGLSVVDAMIKTGQARGVLLVGAEVLSRILDWDDRATCVLFGDGAGAVVLRAKEETAQERESGIISTYIASDGAYHDSLYVDGGLATGRHGFVKMQGREVFRHAVKNMPRALDKVLEQSGIARAAIDLLVPHQANARIIEVVGQKLSLPTDRVVVTVDQHANTSAASIPLALAAAVEAGRVHRGDLLAMVAMGAGFTWGAALVRW